MKNPKLELPRGKHLFLKFEGASRSRLSLTVTVLVRDPDAQPGHQMVNISLPVSLQLDQRWHSGYDAMIMQRVPKERAALGQWIAAELGKGLYQDADAFSWEWL